MPIIISQTYEVYTEESIEAGEAEERGFVFEDAEITFKELVHKLKWDGYVYPSEPSGVPRWVSNGPYADPSTGDVISDSLHPGKDARSQRYWGKALRAAGVIK